ncbi:MAG: hypothetical protein ABJE10_06890 [bacterium]
MSLRTFLSADGTTWTAWRVDSGRAAVVPGTPTEWLAFKNDDDTERRRLLKFPDDWEALSDQLLDLLRRMAEPVLPRRMTPPEGAPRQETPDSSPDE